MLNAKINNIVHFANMDIRLIHKEHVVKTNVLLVQTVNYVALIIHNAISVSLDFIKNHIKAINVIKFHHSIPAMFLDANYVKPLIQAVINVTTYFIRVMMDYVIKMVV